MRALSTPGRPVKRVGTRPSASSAEDGPDEREDVVVAGAGDAGDAEMDARDAGREIENPLAVALEFGGGEGVRVDGADLPFSIEDSALGAVGLFVERGHEAEHAGRGEEAAAPGGEARKGRPPAVFDGAAEVLLLEGAFPETEDAGGDEAGRLHIEEGAVVEAAHEDGVLVAGEEPEFVVVLGVGAGDRLVEGGDGERGQEAGEDLLDVGAGPEVGVGGGGVEFVVPAAEAIGFRGGRRRGGDGAGLEEPEGAAVVDGELDVLRRAEEVLGAEGGADDSGELGIGQHGRAFGPFEDGEGAPVDDVPLALGLAGDEGVAEALDGFDDDVVAVAGDGVDGEGDAGGDGGDHALDDDGHLRSRGGAGGFAVGAGGFGVGGREAAGDGIEEGIAAADAEDRLVLAGEGGSGAVFVGGGGADGDGLVIGDERCEASEELAAEVGGPPGRGAAELRGDIDGDDEAVGDIEGGANECGEAGALAAVTGAVGGVGVAEPGEMDGHGGDRSRWRPGGQQDRRVNGLQSQNVCSILPSTSVPERGWRCESWLWRRRGSRCSWPGGRSRGYGDGRRRPCRRSGASRWWRCPRSRRRRRASSRG
nr:hypothetical protein [Tepidiforma sp.]